MGKGDGFGVDKRKRAALYNAEKSGQVADSIDVRVGIVERMNRGEITLDQAQSELKAIKRGAKKAGKITREQAYRDGSTRVNSERSEVCFHPLVRI